MHPSGVRWEDYPRWRRVLAIVSLVAVLAYLGFRGYAWWQAETQPDMRFQCTFAQSNVGCVFQNVGGAPGEICAIVRLMRTPELMPDPRFLIPIVESEKVCSGVLAPRESVSKAQVGFKEVVTGRVVDPAKFCADREAPDSTAGCKVLISPAP
jgi:hypothetical protein